MLPSAAAGLEHAAAEPLAAAAPLGGPTRATDSAPAPAGGALPPSAAAASAAAAAAAEASLVYPPEERTRIRTSWNGLMRWSRSLRRAAAESRAARLRKVVVFGGGSFGTAMAVALTRAHPGVKVTLLLRDPYLCRDINEKHRNTRYMPEWELPPGVTATTAAAEAIAGAQFAIHAVPVQHTRAFLESIKVRARGAQLC